MDNNELRWELGKLIKTTENSKQMVVENQKKQISAKIEENFHLKETIDQKVVENKKLKKSIGVVED